MSEDTNKGVYCLTFPNGKRYVGIGVGRNGVPERFKMYRLGHCRAQVKLHAALMKYGYDAVVFEHLLKTSDPDRAKRVEKQLIALWGTQRVGYNITAGGDGTSGVKASIETRLKNSAAKMGKKASLATRAKMSQAMLGRICSDETKSKIGEKNRGKTPSVATRAKMSAAKRGKSIPEATKVKMRQSSRAYWDKVKAAKVAS